MDNISIETTTTTSSTVDMNHMIFALVRDPTERFISAVGQVTSSKFSSKGRAKQFKDLCIPPSYEHQEEEGEYKNEHGNEDEDEHEHEKMEQHHDEIKTSDIDQSIIISIQSLSVSLLNFYVIDVMIYTYTH